LQKKSIRKNGKSVRRRGMSHFRRVTIFDLDRTLIRGNASMLFFRYLQKRLDLSFGMMFASLSYFFRHQYMNLSLNQLHSEVFQLYLHSRPKSLLTNNIPGFLKELLPKTLYIPAILQLRTAQQMGHYTLILSNSPDFIVEPIAKYLKVDYWKGTQYMVDKEGCFDKIGFVLDGPAKAQVLRQVCRELNIDRIDTTVYSDSIHDLELLEISGTPVVVNPDRKLRLISEQKNWHVI